MTALKCIIVDDEPLAIKLLADYAARTPLLDCICATTDVMHALKLVQDSAADLVFLDIQMPELSGIQFMKIIRNSCQVVITSAYTEYAIEGYEHNVTDYLLKPVTFDRFLVAVNKAIQRAAEMQTGVAGAADHLFIKSGNKFQRVVINDIVYVEALRDYVAIHTRDQKILTLESMKNMISALPDGQFLRIHKSYIINKGKINSFDRTSVEVEKKSFPVGETYRAEFMTAVLKNLTRRNGEDQK